MCAGGAPPAQNASWLSSRLALMHCSPLAEVPFHRLGMVLIGIFERRGRGYCSVLVLVDYVMRYPDAVLLRSVFVCCAAKALFTVFTQATYAEMSRHRSRRGARSPGLLFFFQESGCRHLEGQALDNK